MNIRIVLADDHPLVRMGVRQILSTKLGFSIVGEAGDVGALFDRLSQGNCDVVVTDLCMPCACHTDGLPMLEAIRQRFPAVRIVVLTMQENAAMLKSALDAGACAVLGKGSGLNELGRAIVAAYQRRRYVARAKARAAAGSPRHIVMNESLTTLSPKEVEVIRLYVGGMSVSDMAQYLGRSVKTVSTHKISAMKKLGIDSDAELCRYGAHNGLLSIGMPRDSAGKGVPDSP